MPCHAMPCARVQTSVASDGDCLTKHIVQHNLSFKTTDQLQQIAWSSTICTTWASTDQSTNTMSSQYSKQTFDYRLPNGQCPCTSKCFRIWTKTTFCATYWVMVLAISKGRQKWLTLHSFPPTVQRWSQPPFWFRFEWTFGNFVSRSFPKLVPLVSPKTRPHSAMHEKLVRTCRRRNTQCTLACTYWCTWCTLACTCTIAPGVLHKCSMAHITLTDMHFSQLGAIAQLEKELSKDWFACSVGLNNKQALKVGSN